MERRSWPAVPRITAACQLRTRNHELSQSAQTTFGPGNPTPAKQPFAIVKYGSLSRRDPGVGLHQGHFGTVVGQQGQRRIQRLHG